jgi:histidinol-phosphatase (PHP family)
MLFDYHNHTPLCHHAKGLPREYVLAAQRHGLSEIGFSDHNPMPTQFDDWRMASSDLPQYFSWIEEARREFSPFPIRLGLECDYLPGYEDHVRHLASLADWDYFIGAVHYITPKWDVDNPAHMGKWKEMDLEEVWTWYFKSYTRMVESGLFDFFAHIDLVKKFGFRPEGDLTRFYRETLEAIADHHGVIEISTAGLRKEVNEIYPSKELLTLAHQKGIRILISSDSHSPEEVGYRFDLALQLAKEVGYEEVTRFEGRQALSVKI